MRLFNGTSAYPWGGTRVSENLASFVVESAEKFGDRPALKLDDTVVNYALLNEGSARIAHLLKEKGLERGDRVGIMLPNVPYFAIVYYGVLRAGGVVVPMNVLLKGREVAFYLEDPEAKILFAWHDFAEAAETGAEKAGAELISVKPGEFEEMLGSTEADHDVADVSADDTAVILYTSGTTGTPKGAELTHGNLKTNAEVNVKTLAQTSEEDVVFGALPLFHSFGQTCGLNSAIAAGACLTLLPRFDPEKAVQMFERDKVTVFLGVPTMYVAMLNMPEDKRGDASGLRLCCSGGSAMPVEVMKGFEEAFGCKVLEGYGLSETSPVASFNHPDRERKPGSIGTPIEGVEMEVVDEDGWFRTGDMGKVDEDGYFFIVDRKKEMIIRGGYNVYPREIEEVLYEHPAVAEAAVVGVPDDKMGEEVGAAVVLKEGKEIDADELRDFVKEQVANYKYPRRIWFPDELPKGPTGKILKREVEVPEEAKTA